MLMTVLGVLLRWVHITSVVILIGGIAYARWALAPAAAAAGDKRIGAETAARYRGWILTALIGILGSGLYNFLTKEVYPPGYHMWFGIKILLVLHIFAVAFLLAKPGATDEKRARWMSGVIVSGFLVIAISSWLRWLSLHWR